MAPRSEDMPWFSVAEGARDVGADAVRATAVGWPFAADLHQQGVGLRGC